MIPTRDQLEEAAAEGLTQIQAAERIGCGPATVQRYRKRYGVAWPTKAYREARFAVVRGKRMSIREIAAEYGIAWYTVAKRWERGIRGNALADPVRHWSQAPDVYELGYPLSWWRDVADLARYTSQDYAAYAFDIPVGAVGAAMRCEWWRLA